MDSQGRTEPLNGTLSYVVHSPVQEISLIITLSHHQKISYDTAGYVCHFELMDSLEHYIYEHKYFS